MKYFFFLLITFSAILNNVKAQVSSGNVLNTYSGYVVSSYDLVLPSFKLSSNVEGSPYFSKDWIKGSVTTTDNQTFNNKLLFMYDKTDNSLYFKNADSNTIMKADMAKILSFILITDKNHTFIRGSFFNKNLSDKFFEVLLLNEKNYSFIKEVKTSFEHLQTSKASQAMTQSISGGKYVDNEKYYFFKNGTLTQISFKKKEIEEELGKDAEKAERYFNNHKGRLNESYVSDMMGDINDQAK